MKKSVITSILLSGFAATTSFADHNRIDTQISESIKRGGIEITTSKYLEITPEVAELIKQISNSNHEYKRPVLIFSDSGVFINDTEVLDQVISSAGQTMTSIK